MLLSLQTLWQQAMDAEQGNPERASDRLTAQIGGKAAKLARLQAHGFPVPQAWALGADVYLKFRGGQNLPPARKSGFMTDLRTCPDAELTPDLKTPLETKLQRDPKIDLETDQKTDLLPDQKKRPAIRPGNSPYC